MTSKAGVQYWTEIVDPDGNVVERFAAPTLNLVPTEGLNHMLGVVLKGAAQVPTWYIGLFEGEYTPSALITAATLPALADECTDYASPTRVEFVEGSVAAGSVDNATALAEFVFTADVTVRGAFITSSDVKGSTSGVLLSIARFPSPKPQTAGSTLRVMAGPTVTSI